MQRSFFDLTSRTKLRVSGTDAERFLNGQLTNDVRKTSHTAAIQACVLSAKGKTNAHVFLSGETSTFLIDADSELRESLSARLNRYIIADDVEVADVTETFSMFHLLGEAPPDLPSDCRLITANRFSEQGTDIWIRREGATELRRRLAETFSFIDGSNAETLRIERGLPTWGHELTEEIIPVEANLEAATIDYEKGCYIGQEVISRIKMSGQTNKRLRGILSMLNEPMTVGMKLFANTGQEVGWLTSVARSERLSKHIALGFVKRGFTQAGSELTARRADSASPSHALPAKIVDLPFV